MNDDPQKDLFSEGEVLFILDIVVGVVVRKKYDDGRQTECQRLNEIAHMYQALSAANS